MTFSEAMSYLFEKPLEDRRVTRVLWQRHTGAAGVGIYDKCCGGKHYYTLQQFFDTDIKESEWAYGPFEATIDDLEATDWKVVE